MYCDGDGDGDGEIVELLIRFDFYADQAHRMNDGCKINFNFCYL